MAANEETPDGQVEGFETIPTTAKEQEMNTPIIAPTSEPVYAEFPSNVRGPAWATKTEDRGLDVDTDFPVQVWYRELDVSDTMASTIEQEAVFNPETREILWRAPVLIVWVDGNTRVVFEQPAKVWQLHSAIGTGVHLFEQALEGAR